MVLKDVKPGQRIRVKSIPNEAVRLQALRFGITEGSLVSCTSRILGGPIVISVGRQEVAFGSRLAGEIIVGDAFELGWEGKSVVAL